MSSSTYLPFVLSLCYKSGTDFNGYLTWFLYNMPITVWYLLSGLAWYSRDTYIQILSSSYWIAALGNYLIAFLTEELRPNPLCNNQGYGMPSWEAQLAYHFIVIMLAHRIFWIRALGLMDIMRGLILGLLIPFWLVFSGNYSLVQVILGAVVGLVTGAFTVQAVFLFWIDRFQILTAHPILNSWGYKHTIPAFYDNTTHESRNAALLNSFMAPVDEEHASQIKYPVRFNKSTVDKLHNYIEINDQALEERTSSVKTTRSQRPMWDHTADMVARALLGGSTF